MAEVVSGQRRSYNCFRLRCTLNRKTKGQSDILTGQDLLNVANN
ncbi:MAG: hypothetical protein JWM68_306 [Verrucomicrobiales bacterium]|nr:hypothetical protein [Verrucomicrobiales bacterium]